MITIVFSTHADYGKVYARGTREAEKKFGIKYMYVKDRNVYGKISNFWFSVENCSTLVTKP